LNSTLLGALPEEMGAWQEPLLPELQTARLMILSLVLLLLPFL
jgi:hypothetical protein